VHVPLLVRAPGRDFTSRRIGASVSLIDLMPTLLDLAAASAPEGLEGESLVPLMNGDSIDRPAWVQNYYKNDLVALGVGPWKYVRRGSPPREELYDVTVDPGETRNLAGKRPDVLSRFASRTTEWLDDQRRRADLARAKRISTPVSPEKAGALRALGYTD
jgi:choline-sulfatase